MKESGSTISHGLIQQLREDLRTHGGDVTLPGFQALAVHRFGAWQLGLGSAWARWFASRLHRVMHEIVRNFYGIELYPTTRIGRRVRICHQGGISIHRCSAIGDDCVIRQGVSIGRGPNHGGGRNDAAPVLGNRVEVGASATLIGGIAIGDDVVIGPGAVVMSSVRPNALVASRAVRIQARPDACRDGSGGTARLAPQATAEGS